MATTQASDFVANFDKLQADALREELASVRTELDAVIVDYQDRLAGAFMDAGQLAMERDALRTSLTEVLVILKSGRSTGRTAIKALYAAEDVAMAALENAQEQTR